MLIRPQSTNFAKIRVVGIGGGGSNAINSMIAQSNIKGVDFISVNTDAQALLLNQAPTKVQIGETLTKGLGSGGDPEIGRQAAEESVQKIKDALEGSDMIFLTAGMGGGTGTGATSVIAETAKQIGALTVGVVTKPFSFEGARRKVAADDGIEGLRDKVDTLITIPNQRIMEVVDRKLSLIEAFKVADSVLTQGVQGISEIITMPGLINVDFADVRSIMSNAGSALMGIGTGVGESRAQSAARSAIASPLLELSIEGARGVLFNIVGGEDLTMTEVDEAAKIIHASADPDANIIFGATIDETMKDQIRITVVATGFDASTQQMSQFVSDHREQRRSFLRDDDDDEERSERPSEPTQPTHNQPQPFVTRSNEMSSQPKKPESDEDEWDIPAFLRQKN